MVLSRHASDRLRDRAIVSPDDVLIACERVQDIIDNARLDGWAEVKVVVKRVKFTVLPDGSNGELIVACVNPHTQVIKTVMLRCKRQVKRDIEQGRCPYVRAWED